MPEEATQDWYGLSIEEQKMLDNNFKYHAPTSLQQGKYIDIRNKAKEFTADVMRRVPPSRERSLAITKIEEAVMWANAGIARNE